MEAQVQLHMHIMSVLDVEVLVYVLVPNTCVYVYTGMIRACVVHPGTCTCVWYMHIRALHVYEHSYMIHVCTWKYLCIAH